MAGGACIQCCVHSAHALVVYTSSTCTQYIKVLIIVHIQCMWGVCIYRWCRHSRSGRCVHTGILVHRDGMETISLTASSYPLTPHVNER